MITNTVSTVFMTLMITTVVCRYERFSEIKKQNSAVKLLLAVGGWNMGSAPFTAMVASDAGRQEFARTAVTFLRTNNFDGLDLDWEYPANRGSPAGDQHKFTLLVQVGIAEKF